MSGRRNGVSQLLQSHYPCSQEFPSRNEKPLRASALHRGRVPESMLQKQVCASEDGRLVWGLGGSHHPCWPAELPSGLPGPAWTRVGSR